MLSDLQVVNATSTQRVKADLIDGDDNSQKVAVFEGVSQGSLHLEDDSTKKAVTWGPFDELMTVELTFQYEDDSSWKFSTIETNKIKEVNSFCLRRLQRLFKYG